MTVSSPSKYASHNNHTGVRSPGNLNKNMIKKPIRNYKGATIEFRPISNNDIGIVKNGSSTLWVRTTGVIGSQAWIPCKGETPQVLRAFRKQVQKSKALFARLA